MKQNSSNRKVNEQAREVIANALLFDVSDPRLSLVTITGCEVSFDRSVCNVYYTADAASYDKVAAAFEKASRHIRSTIARQLNWRVAPQLRFILDATVDHAAAIEAALAQEATRSGADDTAALDEASALDEAGDTEVADLDESAGTNE